MQLPPSPYDRAKLLQDLIVAKVGGEHGVDRDLFTALRKWALSDSRVPGILIPKVVRDHRDLDHLWAWAKEFDRSWEPRRRHVRDQFTALLDYLEANEADAPADALIAATLTRFDAEGVAAAWARALGRRAEDPEGAITAARTLLETVLKHVLVEARQPFDDADDLPKLYRLVADKLSLAPSQHTEDIFKRILGGCTQVVEGIGAIRNKIGDAHGKGPRPVKPSDRHAALVVNLAGAMATFIVETWAARQTGGVARGHSDAE